jgi:hypothetical protein
MKEPLHWAGRGILAIAEPEQPVPAASDRFDLILVTHQEQLLRLVPWSRHHLPCRRSGPSARAMRKRLRRQMNKAGGWSGSIAVTWIGSGGSSLRAGRGRSGFQLRLSPAHRAGRISTDRSGMLLAEGLMRYRLRCPNRFARASTKAPQIRAAASHAFKSFALTRRQRLKQEHDESHGFNAQTGIDRLDLRGEQLGEMGRVA